MAAKRRSSFEIMIDLLHAARKQRFQQMQTDGGIAINKRQMMRSANLNHGQLSSYLDTLQGKSFITKHETDDGLHLEITDKGEELLDRAEKLSVLLG